MLVWGNKTI
jgi:hypothetical protein